MLVISSCFGIAAAVGMSSVMGKSGSSGPEIKMGPVIVAVEALEHNALLNEENVKIDNWPMAIIPENAARSIDEIKDMATQLRLSPGMPILVTDVIPKEQRNSIAVPPGFKVVGIKATSADTNNGLLSPGDKVDVIGMFKVRKKDQQITTSKTFLKRITVFAVNSELRRSNERTGDNGTAIVSVLLNEAQAEQFIFVEQEAEIRLIMCGEEESDDEAYTGELVDLSDMLNPGNSENAPEDIESDSPYRGMAGSMRIYSGSSFEDHKFRDDGRLDVSPVSTRVPSRDSGMSKGEDRGSFDGNAGGVDSLEQDQYPGE